MSQLTHPPADAPLPAPVCAEVAVLLHDQRHSLQVRVFADYDAALRARAGIARAGWAALAEVATDLPADPPVDDIEAAELYFGHLDDEDASVRLLTVEPAPADEAPVQDPPLAGLLAMLPALSDRRAYAVLHSLATGRGWQYALWDATDVEGELMGHEDWPLSRRLTDAQWAAVRITRAWGEIGDLAGQRVADSDTFYDVLCQAGIVCVDCDALISGPLTATWGRCDTCRTARPLAELQAEACPADSESSHPWDGPACAGCAMPSPQQVACLHCQQQVPLATAHRWRGAWIGGACCWDERRHATQ
ncbi:MAG: hypothetical protein V7603_5045 [Micromonosporaceae bacterium]